MIARINMQILNMHLVSDFTCDSLMSISGVIATQFSDIKINRYFWPFVRNIDQVDDIMNSVKNNPGIVLLSVLSVEIEDKIKADGKAMENVRVIPAMDYILAECASYLDLPIKHQTRRGLMVGEDYMARAEAMSYTINHDDGRMQDDLNGADIILIGLSRTSKSPTSIYLSHRGYKVANIPFISASLMPNLQELKKPMIVGLTIDPERLMLLRESRLVADGVQQQDFRYSQIEYIVDELREFRRFCGKLNCQVIDVTRKSIEEVAAYVIKLYQTQKS